jgi:hypothetical protein
MSNTSATGGYLTQGTPAPSEGQALRRFLQAMLVGVTGLPNNLVRQSWEANPAPVPSIETNWMAFGIESQRSEAGDPYHRQRDDGSSLLIRHEELDVACIFYGPDAQQNANLLRDGLYLAQNRESMYSVGMGLVGFSETFHVPELINDRFFDRADITMTLRREVRREYPVLHFLAADGIIYANRHVTTLTREWSV